MRLSTGIVGAALLAAIAAGSSVSAQERNREAAVADVREAVVRYQIQTWYFSVDSYCISVNRKNAHKAFLERFAPLPVKQASACAETRRRGIGRMRQPTWVADKQTGEPAVVFEVGAIRWLGDDAAEVKGGYYCSFRCWAAGTYQIIRDNNGWTVTDFNIETISRNESERETGALAPLLGHRAFECEREQLISVGRDSYPEAGRKPLKG